MAPLLNNQTDVEYFAFSPEYSVTVPQEKNQSML